MGVTVTVQSIMQLGFHLSYDYVCSQASERGNEDTCIEHSNVVAGRVLLVVTDILASKC